MASEAHQAWDTENVSRASGIALKSGGDELVATARPRGLVQKLAYKADGFLVSQIAKLQPADLKEPPELLRDLTAFASTDDYRASSGVNARATGTSPKK